MKVSPRLGHSWVNDQMIVSGSPGINNVRLKGYAHGGCILSILYVDCVCLIKISYI